jgi:hypothetical protein
MAGRERIDVPHRAGIWSTRCRKTRPATNQRTHRGDHAGVMWLLQQPGALTDRGPVDATPDDFAGGLASADVYWSWLPLS